MKPKILTRMVEQFQAKHSRLPAQVVIDPLALVVLSKRRSVAPVWNGIPVVCREVELKAPEGKPSALGVCIVDNELRSVEL